MALRAIRSRSLADQVFGQIVGEILIGRYAPGMTLPAERTLVSVFDVNRHVVREALKRLEQIGLVKVSQGGGTQVLDFKRSAGLDLLALMAEHARGGEDFASIWASVLEMRAAIGTDIARLCALRASAAVKKELLEVTAEMGRASTEDLVGLELRFWDLVIEGAQNLAYRLAFNSMVKGALTVPELSVPWVVEDLRNNGQRAVVAAAIAVGDATRAEAAAREVLCASHETFLRLVGTERSAGPAIVEARERAPEPVRTAKPTKKATPKTRLTRAR